MLRRVLLAAALAASSGCEREAGPVRTRAPDTARGTAPTVVVIEFFEYGCHYCAEFTRIVQPAIEREFVTAGVVEWREVPFAAGSTPRAFEAATAAECARQQRAGPAMSRLLFADRPSWLRVANPERAFARHAATLGLDGARFRACYRSAATAGTVARQRQLARDVGVRIAPTFLVNGVRVEGALDLARFRELVTSALQSSTGP